jgi:hypothetical protein
MENEDRLTVEQLRVLSNELVTLTKQQSDARLLEVFIRMSKQEIKDFDERKARISQIYTILWKHDSKRS